jgi:signal transduction histidine kinase/ActR/RegA family two-component response regulator
MSDFLPPFFDADSRPAGVPEATPDPGRSEERVSEGRSTGTVLVVPDSTERQNAERALRQSNERLHLLYEVATALALGGEPWRLIDHLYQKLAAHLGVEIYLNYLVQKDGQTLRLQHHSGVPDDVAREIECLPLDRAVCGAVVRDRRPAVVFDVQHSTDPRTALIRALGITAYVCHPLLAHGRLIGTLSFGTRARTRFDAEEIELMRSVCDHVAVAIDRAELLAELEHRARQLAEADRRKDEFLATLGHELRNPLAPLRNALHLLRLPETDNPTAGRARAMMERQVGQLTRLVDDLLDVSRIVRGKVRLHREVVEVGTVVRRAVEAVRPAIDHAGHALVVALSSEPMRLKADPARLEQVLTNLLTNAAKYTERGGRIGLTVEQVPSAPIPLPLGERDRSEGEVVIRVRDTGIGMGPELLPRVFDLFTQAERSLDRAQGGLGIGLALVRSLVEMHGGSVSAHSDGPGQGSEFVVRLPLWKDEGGRMKDESRSGSSHPSAFLLPPSAKRVLVVDDNLDAAESLALVLRMDRHQVATAHDGPAALETARAFRPEVVLLDIGLPRLDGYAVARRLRQEPGLEGVLLVALTGYGQEEDKRKARDAGFDRHFVKPVGPEELQGLLAEPEHRASSGADRKGR